MSLSLGMKAEIRTLIFVAGEPIPLFWPMRSFIHHNPLQGLEKLSFEDAIAEGEKLFHGKGFLHRNAYQTYYNEMRNEVLHKVIRTDCRYRYAQLVAVAAD